ncbi:hypothetical protein MIND_00591200 [Mycena indigotica]|uniref:Uncharacterized protein n=1 Tax=Mycena indigotica TaxID=2126181 RepID=A0A8H6SQL0_9AGAR|nr:uncharacterized protein MIND_00591200 [Mycena indigotica]KAF7303619.1 hypothetical protein MIND_00591200 [Mycena indigotica]
MTVCWFFMLSWLLSRFWDTPPPAGVRVVPCTGMDAEMADMILTTILVVDARLDPKKLENSVSLLVEKKFPRAGARLARRNEKYEFQIPQDFSPSTPAVSFTCSDYSEPYDSPSRPSLATLRVSKPTAPFVCQAPALWQFSRGKTCPNTVQDLLKPNTPLVHIHVTTFNDITFVGVTSTHAMFDAMGTKIFLHAWTRVLSGEPLDDIPGMPWDVAPFSSFASQTFPKGWVQRGLFKLGFISRWLWSFRFKRRLRLDPFLVGMAICMPKAFLERHKQDVMAELQDAGSKEWVSSSDVLLAWLVKLCYSYRQDTTVVHMNIPSNLRERRVFPTASGTIETPYIHNAVMPIALPPFNANTVAVTPLRDIALGFRRTILAFDANIDAIKNDLRWRCSDPTAYAYPCPPGAEYSLQTNWRSANYTELDFSGAVSGNLCQENLKPRVLAANGAMRTERMRDGGAIMYESEDCIWIAQLKGAKQWAAIKATGSVEFKS